MSHLHGVVTGATRPALVLSMTPNSDYALWLTRQGFAATTITNRVSLAEHLLREWGTWDVSPDVIVGWLSRHHGWTRRTYHNHLVSLYRWLTDVGALPVSPMVGVRQGAAPRPRPRPLTGDELARALAGAEGRLRAWLLLGVLAGLRSHEIAKVHGRDVTATGIYVLGKGGQGATVPTHPDLWALAQSYPRDGFWFPSPMHARDHVSASLVGQRIHEHFRSLGIDGSIHRTRATYGTTLLRNGVNLRVIQDLMRHRSLASTEHYLGVGEDERAAAIRGLAA